MAFKGPLLQTAALCETVIEGKDGVLSIIRLIDRITITAAGPNAPKDMPPMPQQLTAVLAFKSGSAKGRQDVKLVMERPNAESKEVWSGSMLAEAPDRGHNFVLRFQETFDLEGLYWFHVYAEEQLMTSIPLRLLYTRQSVGTQS